MANIDHTIFGNVRKKLIDMGDGTHAERIHAGDLMKWQDGRGIRIVSSVGTLFSDDFGGSALDTANNWTVLDGGLSANPNLKAVITRRNLYDHRLARHRHDLQRGCIGAFRRHGHDE